MKSSKKIPVVIFVLALLIIAILRISNFHIAMLLPNIFRGTEGKLWDLDTVIEYFETPLPADAEMIDISGNMGRGQGLNLSFQSSSETMADYVSIFCDSLLYKGYDPFNAIDVAESQTNAVRITMETSYQSHTYYSYSPVTSDTIYGNRCVGPDKRFQLQIIVDKTNNERHSFRLELRYDCTKCWAAWPTSEP